MTCVRLAACCRTSASLAVAPAFFGLALAVLALVGCSSDSGQGGLPEDATSERAATCDEGDPCDDNDPCTQDDRCAADGSCAGEPYSCDDGLPCTVDSCDGAGQCTSKLLNGRCLIDGACYTEGDPDPDNPCSECMTVVSKSAWSNDDTNECDDSDVCTVGDHCSEGSCVPGQDLLSCNDDNVCTSDTCDPAVGCEHTGVEAACDDGNECTQGDSCKEGLCGGVPKDCSDGNSCTADSCDETTGCVHEAAEGACDDANPCTVGDLCVAGGCTAGAQQADCNDSNVCTADGCNPGEGCVHTPVEGPCDDGNACSIGDTCTLGECQPGGEAPDCNDSNTCTQDECDPALGCIHPVADGGCSDGNVCTVGDACAQGSCQPGIQSLGCDDGDVCTDDACDPATGCIHVANTAPCDDGNECTVNDACQWGQCGGTLRICDDGVGCTTDKCNPFVAGGCVYTPNDLPCDDGNECTLGDTCMDGQCMGGMGQLNCDDGNECTDDSCVPGAGCKHKNKVAFCDDGNPCTQGDYCAAGMCIAGGNQCACAVNSDCAKLEDGDKCNGNLYCLKTDPSPLKWSCQVDPGTVVTCNKSQDTFCKAAVCVPATGLCSLSPVHEGEGCNDGNYCTANDACKAGACLSYTPVSCDDGNACTTDSCVPATGCTHTVLANGTSCGAAGFTCLNGQCLACAPKCAGKACGDDGCGSVCGTCLVNESCIEAKCMAGPGACTGEVLYVNGAHFTWFESTSQQNVLDTASQKLLGLTPVGNGFWLDNVPKPDFPLCQPAPWVYIVDFGCRQSAWKFRVAFPAGYDSFVDWTLEYTTDAFLGPTTAWLPIADYHEVGFKSEIKKTFQPTPATTRAVRVVVYSTSRGTSALYNPDLGIIQFNNIVP